MANYDGEIRVNTKLDKNNFNKGLNVMSDGIDELMKKFKMTKEEAEAFEKQWNEISKKHPEWKVDVDTDKATEEIEEIIHKEEEAQTAVQKTNSELEKTSEVPLEQVSEKVEKITGGFDNLSANVEDYKTRLRELENNGYGFGDSNYDALYLEWKNANDELTKYKANLDSQSTSGIEKQAEEQRKIEEQAERNLQKEVEKAQKEAETSEKIREQEAEEQRLVDIKNNAIIADTETVALEERKIQIQQRLNELKRAGVGAGYTEFDGLTSELSTINNELKRYQTDITESEKDTEKFEKTGVTAFSRVKNAVSGIGNSALNVFSNVGTVIKKATSHIKLFNKHANNSSSSLGRFGTRVLELAKSALIFSSLTKVFTSMVNSVKTGLKQFESQSSTLKTAMDNLRTSSNVLGAQLTSALAPIVAGIANLFASLANQISVAVGYLAQFIAFLGGSKTYKKAVSNLNAVEDAANGASKATKGALASFDELNNTNSSSGGGSGSTPSYVWEDADVLVDFDDIDPYELGQQFAKKISEALENIDWDEIEKQAEEIGRTIAQFLNGVFSDENLAKELGEAIAGCLNTALALFYGFIDEFDWKQAGKWLGILIQTGIEEFNWERLGETIAKLLNGLADYIIGFFDGYDVGTLGSSLARMLNKAIETIDMVKIANALAMIVQGAAEEITVFFNDTDWKTAGKKLSDFFINFFTHMDDGKTIAQSIGDALASMINAGIDFVMGYDVGGAIQSFAKFFGDMILEAIRNIDWINLAKQAVAFFLDALTSATSGLMGSVMEAMGMDQATVDTFLRNTQSFSDAVGVVTDGFEKLNENQEKVRQGLELTESDFSSGIQLMTDYEYAMNELGNGTEYTASQFLELQDKLGLTNDETDTLVQTMYDANENLDDVSLGLQNYAGDWGTFKNSISSTKDAISDTANTTKTKTAEMSSDMNSLSASTSKSTGEVKQYIKSVDDSLSNSATSSSNWTNTIGESADSVSEKLSSTATKASESGTNTGTEFANSMATSIGDNTESVATASATLAESASQSMEDSTTAYDTGVSFATAMALGITESSELVTTALSEMILTMQTTFTESFSVEMWTPYFTNMITAFQAQWMLFLTQWTTNLVLWKANNILYYFGVPVWTLLWNNILLAYRPKWTEFSTEWKTNMDNWKLTMVDPFFAVELWTQYGDNMKVGIEGGFNGIVDSIGNVLNAIADMFNQLMENIKDSMNDMVDDFNEIAAQLGVDTIKHVSFSKVSSVDIPRLATGTVIPPGMSEFLAVLGDNNHDTEVVSPLTTMKQAMMEAINEMGGVGGSDGDIIVQCILDGKVVFEEVRKRNREYRKQTGSNAFA